MRAINYFNRIKTRPHAFNVCVTQNFIMKPDITKRFISLSRVIYISSNYFLKRANERNVFTSFRLECLLKYLLGWMLWNAMHINLFKWKWLSSHAFVCLISAYERVIYSMQLFQLSSKLIDNLWKLSFSWIYTQHYK